MHHLVDVEVSDGRVLVHEICQVRFRSRLDAVSLADDERDTFGFELLLPVRQLRAVLYPKCMVCSEMAEKQVSELVRQRHKLHRRGMVLVDENPVGIALFVTRRPLRASDRAGLRIARIEIGPEDVSVGGKLAKPSDLNVADRPASEKRG